MILTKQMVIDKLALNGSMGLIELTRSMDLDPRDNKNEVMGLLTELMVAGDVTYDYDNGTYETDKVLA